MPSIQVTHTIDDLESDCRKIATMARGKFRSVVREAAKVGNTVAKDNASRTAGTHGKHYPKAFTWEMLDYGGGSTIRAEYGPDRTRKQGAMSFEFGSRNQPPHLDLAKSADLIGPAFANEARQAAESLFWPAGPNTEASRARKSLGAINS